MTKTLARRLFSTQLRIVRPIRKGGYLGNAYGTTTIGSIDPLALGRRFGGIRDRQCTLLVKDSINMGILRVFVKTITQLRGALLRRNRVLQNGDVCGRVGSIIFIRRIRNSRGDSITTLFSWHGSIIGGVLLKSFSWMFLTRRTYRQLRFLKGDNVFKNGINVITLYISSTRNVIIPYRVGNGEYSCETNNINGVCNSGTTCT